MFDYCFTFKTKEMNWLHKIIDDSLEKMSKSEILMMTPAEIPEEMQDNSIKKSDDWGGWRPIKSQIQDTEIGQLESEIGFPLPHSYREFLKFKHFFSLVIPDRAVVFSGVLPNERLSFLKENIFEMMIPEEIIGRGYIYFADFEDYGLLCFNANEKVENNEYPVVFMDHENLEEVHLYANNFRELMEADEERGNRFIEYLNDYYK